MKAKSESQLIALCHMITLGGFPTGSRIFGVETKNSDYDYVMDMATAYPMYRELGIEPFKEPSEDYAGNFISLKYKSGEKWINLILVPTEYDLEAWIYATEQMQRMRIDLIRDTFMRKAYFGWLLTEYYSYIPKGKHYKAALDLWGSGTVPR